MNDKTKCEICGEALPLATDKASRRIRSAHFEAHAQERRRAVLAEPAEQEPAAIVIDAYDTPGLRWLCKHPPVRGDKLYTATQPAKRVELTDEQAVYALREAIADMHSIGCAVENSAALVGYFCNRLNAANGITKDGT